MRATCSTTASISGRPRWVPRTTTCPPGRTPRERSTSKRAYSSIRESCGTSGRCNPRRAARQPRVVLLERPEELFDLERRQGRDLRRAPCRERNRDLGDRGDVGRLDHVHEVELAERRPLVEDPAAELLDVVVHLAEALRIRLEGLDPLLRQRREEDEDRHAGRTLLPRVRAGRDRRARRRRRATGRGRD